jgi:hypothetical protein
MKSTLITILVNIALLGSYIAWAIYGYKPGGPDDAGGIIWLMFIFAGHFAVALVVGIIATVMGHDRMAKVFYISVFIPVIVGCIGYAIASMGF